MRRLSLMCGLCLLLASPALAETAKNYLLTIDGQEVGIDLGETVVAKTADGREIKVSLGRNDSATFDDKLVTFKHASALSVASAEVAKGIRQHLLATATGTVVLVQEYDHTDTNRIVELMLTELTKEDVKAGGQLAKEPSERLTPSGKPLKGLKARISKPDGNVLVEVLAYGTPEQGILAVTRLEAASAAADQGVLDRFWQTIEVKF